MHKTYPDFYQTPLSAESSEHRENVEKKLEGLYAELQDAVGIPRMKLSGKIETLEQQLAWQGANPKRLPVKLLREHVRAPSSPDYIENKYKERIKNRATAIRAYCVSCQGGHVAGVKECASVTCPLHAFRLGSDPLRGWELPKLYISYEDDDEALADFEEADDGDDSDAQE